NAWEALVSVAYQVAPDYIEQEVEVLARATGASKTTVLRKFQAVRHKREQGWTEEAIVTAGQGATLSAFATYRKRERTEADVILRYRVPESLADSWLQLQTRISQVARLRTSEELIEFLHSCFVDLSDQEIRNLAGQ